MPRPTPEVHGTPDPEKPCYATRLWGPPGGDVANYVCELPAGHEEPHRCETELMVMEWPKEEGKAA